MLKIHLLLHSRSDIFSQTSSVRTSIVILEVVAGTTKQVNCISQPASTLASGNLVFVHFILGIKAAYNGNYIFRVDDVQVGPSSAKYSLFSNVDTTFTIQTVYFSATAQDFSYGFQEINLPTTINTYNRVIYF